MTRPRHALDAPQSTRGRSHALRTLPRLRCLRGCTPGSNNWVIAGKHTASGKPLLSNDMHLGLTVPEHLVHGRPAGSRLSRRGRHAARSALRDRRTQRTRRLGIHRALRRCAGSLRRKARWQGQLRGSARRMAAAGHTDETIHVRFGRDVKLDVQLTAHGPLLNPLFQKRPRHRAPLDALRSRAGFDSSL